MKPFDLLEQLNALDEHSQIEAKTASELGKSVVETVCAFANEPGLGGGWILLGAKLDEDAFFRQYEAVGVPDPDRLSRELAGQCSTQFNRPIRVSIEPGLVNGKTLLAVFVSEVEPSEKPIYFKARSLPAAAFRRVGSTNVHCTEDDLAVFYQDRRGDSFDTTVVRDADWTAIDPAMVAEYRQLRKDANPSAEELNWSDEELLNALRCVSKDQNVLRPTIAGLLLFGSPQALRRCANRLEIRNPGHSLIAADRLGEPGSQSRNPVLAAALHDTNLAETKGSGIRVMRDSMTGSGLTPPTFESDRERDQFVVTLLFHHFLTPEDWDWLRNFQEADLTDEEARALVFVREIGAITNADYRAVNRVSDVLQASQHLRRLRDRGLLVQKGKGFATYYRPSEALLQPWKPRLETNQPTGKTGEPTGKTGEPTGKTGEPSLEREPMIEALPSELRSLVATLGKKAPKESMEDTVVLLCEWKPFSTEELANVLSRTKEWVRDGLIRPLLDAGRLIRTIPAQPKHPQQRYRGAPRKLA